MIGAFLLWTALEAYAKQKGVPVGELLTSIFSCGNNSKSVPATEEGEEDDEEKPALSELTADSSTSLAAPSSS